HDKHAAHADGQFKPPIDVEARLHAMKFEGPGDSSIHQTQLSVTASLLRSGVTLLETTRIVLEATRTAAANDAEWNWNWEELKILRMAAILSPSTPCLLSSCPTNGARGSSRRWRRAIAPISATTTAGFTFAVGNREKARRDRGRNQARQAATTRPPANGM